MSDADIAWWSGIVFVVSLPIACFCYAVIYYLAYVRMPQILQKLADDLNKIGKDRK